DGVAALEAEAREPDRIGARLLQYLFPGPHLPDAEVLVPIGRPVAVTAGIADQELGERVRLSGGVDRHGAVLPDGPRAGRGRLGAAEAAASSGAIFSHTRWPRNNLLPCGVSTAKPARLPMVGGRRRRASRNLVSRATEARRPSRRADGDPGPSATIDARSASPYCASRFSRWVHASRACPTCAHLTCRSRVNPRSVSRS